MDQTITSLIEKLEGAEVGALPSYRFAFVGRPDADGWMPWSGGENPVPGRMVDFEDGTVILVNCLSDTFDVWDKPGRFRLAPTAPVEASGSELHPATGDLVDRFAAELKSKLARAEAKYGYRDDWSRPGWEDELIESLAEHIQKGDPRDVAAYCAFAWHHGWSTSDAAGHLAPSHHLQPNREQIAKCIRRAVGDAWIGETQAEVAAEAVLKLRPQPSGFIATLTDDQRAETLAYTGDDTHPQPSGETREAAIKELIAGYAVMHEAICFMAGTSGADGRWYYEKASAAFEKVKPLHVFTEALSARPLALKGQQGDETAVRWGLVWQGETTWFDTKEKALSAKGSSQGVELVSSFQEWRSGEGAPVYPKGTVVSYRGRHFRALRDVKASAKTNAPNYSGFWEEVK